MGPPKVIQDTFIIRLVIYNMRHKLFSTLLSKIALNPGG